MGHRAGVVQAHGRVEIARQPLLECPGIHPALLDPAPELELRGQLIGLGPDVHGAEAGAGLSDVVGEQIDGGVGGIRVIVHPDSMRPRAWQMVASCPPQTGFAQLSANGPPIAPSSATCRRTAGSRTPPSPSACTSPLASLRRLKRLERDGTIRGYRAILDRRRVGLDLTVFVEVKLTAHSQRRAEEFAAAVAEIDAVVACHIVAGMADMLLEVVVPDLPAYEQLLLETLLELPGVTDVRSNVAIRTVKEQGLRRSRPVPT